MDKKFDIFRRLPTGEPIWVKAVEGLEEARRQIHQMVLINPGEYFIFDTRKGSTIRVP